MVNLLGIKSPTVCMFGDSLTKGGLATRVKETLGKYSTPNFIGTVADALGTNAEGRSGWAISNYTGARTLFHSGIAITDFPSFLKLADATDKANKPNYCFTRTGKAKEDTYTTAVDKTQAFYIFDFAHYLTVNSFEIPDVVVINMATNDLPGNKAEVDGGVSIIKASAELMINQINAAAPNCKILIIPIPVRFASSYSTPIINWVKQAMTLPATYPYVDVVCQYAHQNKEFSFPATETAISGRIDKSYAISDVTHTVNGGYKEGAKPIAFYILNQL